MRFTKAHGLGNDFILVAEKDAPAGTAREAWTRRLCDRHRGIGGDGVVLHSPSPDGIRFFLVNADGLPGDISGNGLRCLAALAVREGWAPAHHVVETVVGPRPVEVERVEAEPEQAEPEQAKPETEKPETEKPETEKPEQAKAEGGGAVPGGLYRIATGMGVPRLRSTDVPIALEPALDRVTNHPVEVEGRTVSVTATSMGNPHCALFLDERADDALLTTLGPALENHPLFPERTNVELITVVSRDEIHVRFWERGVGYTEASGTGSASAVVASIITGRTDRKVRAVCDGGVLEISWLDDTAPLHQVGEAELVFDGDWPERL